MESKMPERKYRSLSFAMIGTIAVGAFAASMIAAPKLKPRILQTNYAGDNISIIDPDTNKVVGQITGIELGHGVAVAPDASHIYVSDEAEETLDVVDGKTLQVTKRIPLDGHPNNIAISPNGLRVYVALLGDTGGVDAIDTATEKVANHILTGNTVHNPYITPDGRFLLAGSQPGKNITVIDTETEKVAWTVDMGLGVRPLTMSVNPDGSTKWIFAQLTGLNGFAVVDFATHKEINRIKNPDITPGKKAIPGGGEVSHGMAVTKDQKTLLVCSRVNTALYSYSLPELKVQGAAELGGKGAGWLTLSPDSKRAYVANAITNDVSVVDISSMQEIALIHVGYTPKRSTTAMLQ
jgi:YVTN family beta-propeller protein